MVNEKYRLLFHLPVKCTFTHTPFFHRLCGGNFCHAIFECLYQNRCTPFFRLYTCLVLLQFLYPIKKNSAIRVGFRLLERPKSFTHPNGTVLVSSVNYFFQFFECVSVIVQFLYHFRILAMHCGYCLYIFKIFFCIIIVIPCIDIAIATVIVPMSTV